ncbi:MAG: permease-like cell division protein FtsX [Patescibacteria group bacterium]
MITELKRSAKLGWTSFTRDGGVMATTIFILTLTVLLVSSIFLLEEVSNILINNLEEKVDISVYFKEEINEDNILNIKEEISQISATKNVKYISQEQALEIFLERHKEDPVILKSLEEIGTNPFLASLNIQADGVDEYEEIAGFLENSDFNDQIEKIDYYQRKPVIERIFALTKNFKNVGLAFSIVLAFLSFLVVLNTTRLAIYNLREEINVQKLVGASNWFVRGPFLFQGIIAGFLAFLIALFVFSLTCRVFSPKIQILFSDINVWQYFADNIFVIILIQLSTGIGLGVVSSAIAIRKHLKV